MLAAPILSARHYFHSTCLYDVLCKIYRGRGSIGCGSRTIILVIIVSYIYLPELFAMFLYCNYFSNCENTANHVNNITREGCGRIRVHHCTSNCINSVLY